MRYEITLACDVPCYATFTIEAADRASAIKQALIEAEDVAFQRTTSK